MIYSRFSHTEGNTIDAYKLATSVGLGDEITIDGTYSATYNNINSGATATIHVVHGDNHTYENGQCTVCGTSEPVAGSKVVVLDFSTVSGVQYANETKRFEDVTVSTYNEGCHFNTQLRIYDSSSNNGWAIIQSPNVISSLVINMGYKKATLEVYGSIDGTTWVLIEKVATTSTSYLDYNVNVGETAGYKHIKIEATGAQIRVAKITLTVTQ